MTEPGEKLLVCVVLATYTGFGPSWSAWVEPCLGPDHGQYQQVSLLTNLPYQPYVFCICAVGMLEKFKLSWRLTAHQHPSEGLKNPSHYARPLNSLVSLLNDAIYGPLQLPGRQGRCIREWWGELRFPAQARILVRAGCSSLSLGKLDVLPSMRVSIAWALSMATGPHAPI